MSDMHDAWFFIGIFVFIFIIWIAIGGPTRPIAFTSPRLPAPGALGGGTFLQLPRAPFDIGTTKVSLPSSSGGTNTAGRTVKPLPSFLGGSFGEPSPYRGMATLRRNVSGAGASNPVNESVEITVAQNAGVPVNLSGWRLVSDATSKTATIPKGTEIPTSGTINESEDIVLTPGIRAIVISGSSPIGASFRENKCIGYFSTFQKFSPSLPQNCPMPQNELATFYEAGYLRDASCLDAVKKISRCQVMLTPPTTVSNACQNFMVKYLNYNGCVTAHKNDTDFLGTTWRIYLGRTSALWRPTHEIVKLLDTNSKTVDAFGY
ncbi:MAG: hypothetical protein WC798_01445 [Candidatus Paceibacterota bacterium]|jgi:hypothetical protein